MARTHAGSRAAQGWKNLILISHERVDSRFLVLPGTACSLEDETRNGERNTIEILNGGQILVNCKYSN